MTIEGRSTAEQTDIGEPSCAVLLAGLWRLVDGEFDTATCTRLHHHLVRCTECRAQRSLAVRFKALIASRCRPEPRPPNLPPLSLPR